MDQVQWGQWATYVEGLVRTGSLLHGQAAIRCPSIPLVPLLQGLGCVSPPSWLLWLWHLIH